MYKRKKKVPPQASSTLIGNAMDFSSQSSISTSLTDNISVASRPESPKKSDALSSISAIDKENITSNKAFERNKEVAPTQKMSEDELLNLLSSPVKSQKRAAEVEVFGSQKHLRRDVLSDLGPNAASSEADVFSERAKNFFEETLNNAGFYLSHDSSPNILKKDQAVFVRDVGKALSSSKHKERSIDTFLSELKKYLSNKDAFKSALMPTKTDSNLDSTRGEHQACLIRLLLTIEFLQRNIMDFLLESLGEYIIPEDDGFYEECTMWVRLILQPMQFLPKLVSPKEVTSKLFDVIHSTSISVLQHEMITSLPEITGDEQHDEVSKELFELLRTAPNLTPTILNALKRSSLDGDRLFELQMTLIRKLRKTELTNVGSYVTFIISSPPPNHMDEMINGIRSELVICQKVESMTQEIKKEKSEELSSMLMLIFEKIHDQFLLNKKFADIWLKNISKVKSFKHHKPIDLCILLIFYSVASDPVKQKAVETLFKTKIRSGHFQTSLFDDALEVAPVLFVTYFSDLLKLLSTLLVVNDVIVSKFFASFYVSCFSKMENYHRKMIIINLIENITKNLKCSKPVLRVLHHLTESYTSHIAPFSTRLAHLLDLVNDMKIGEMRDLIDILCTIAYSDCDNAEAFQDELIMVAQKQIRCPDPKIFRSGIICALTEIKHMVNVKEGDPNETPEDSEMIVLSGLSEKAYNLLELVLFNTQPCPEAHVLTFDQLSYAITNCPNMDRSFMKKVSILMQNSLKSLFIIPSSDFNRNDDLETALEYCLDDDLQDPIALDLVSPVIDEVRKKKQVPVCIVALPSLLRVIKGLQMANLSDIDALLGCALAIPSLNFFTKFASVEPYYHRIALDCLFHACNWFRETLNTFVYLIKENSPENILIRLRAVVQLENLILSCLRQAVSYTPPSYYLENVKPISFEKVKKPKVAKGKKKKPNESQREDETLDEPPATQPESEDEREKEEEVINIEYSKLRDYLREFDMDVFIILSQPLTLTPKAPNGCKLSPELGPSEMLLLLEDLNAKLKHCLEAKKPLMKNTEVNGFDNLMSLPIDSIIRCTLKMTVFLAKHLQKIIEYFHKLFETHDGIMDAAGMFLPGTAELKKCLALIFSIYNVYFSWPELKSDEYIMCLIKSALKLGNQSVNKNTEVTLNYSLQSAINYLKTISKYILDVNAGVNLVTLVDTLRSLQDDTEEKESIKLDDICEQFLTRKWYDFKGTEAKGTAINQQMSKLLEFFFIDGNLDKIFSTLSWLVEEVPGLNENPNLTVFPHFNKNTLYILISCVCKTLTSVTKKGLEGKNYSEQLEIWDRAIKILQKLVIVVKSQDSKLNLRQFLKGCLPMLKLFLSHGMQAVSPMIKLEPRIVSQLLKNLQVITRYIQNVCNYSKVSRDNLLIQQLPGLRGTLETILLTVKNIMLQNKCTGAFFMGSMKNKDHHGEIIHSQEESTEEPSVDEAAPAEAMETEEMEGESEEIHTASPGTLSQAC